MEIDSAILHSSPQYIGKWNIYLQYQSGAEWKYYNQMVVILHILYYQVKL